MLQVFHLRARIAVQVDHDHVAAEGVILKIVLGQAHRRNLGIGEHGA